MLLAEPPIVEAIVEFDCEVPTGFLLESIEESAKHRLESGYPNFDRQLTQQVIFADHGESGQTLGAMVSTRALRFAREDRRQIVQFRPGGFSFNRLAPYTRLDEYLDEIRRTWEIFVEFVHPGNVTSVKLQYVNRLLLPLIDTGLDFHQHLKVSPQLPDESGLVFSGFVNQHTAIEVGTENEAKIVLMTQPAEGASLPLIFDIAVGRSVALRAESWDELNSVIGDLRRLKNVIFRNTLTPECLAKYSTAS